jgi:hypothetical protein
LTAVNHKTAKDAQCKLGISTHPEQYNRLLEQLDNTKVAKTSPASPAASIMEQKYLQTTTFLCGR